MARIVFLEQVQGLPPRLRLNIGDVIVLSATGCRVIQAEPILEQIGAFVEAVASGTGDIIEPAGPPTRCLIRAVRAGSAEIVILSGDPWSDVSKRSLSVTCSG